MGTISYLGGHCRKLWCIERDEFKDHLLRLEKTSRYMRFGCEVNDEFIENYASHALDHNCRVWGYFGPRGNLRGTGELKCFANKPGSAEAAFTVEKEYRDKGVGTQLFSHVILSARNRDINHLYVNCLRQNQAMKAIARKFDAGLCFDQGDVIGDLMPANSTVLTRLEEALEDSSGFVYGMLDIQQRWIGLGD